LILADAIVPARDSKYTPGPGDDVMDRWEFRKKKEKRQNDNGGLPTLPTAESLFEFHCFVPLPALYTEVSIEHWKESSIR
jgi:hypothetical protein